jgi:hypothetical protein
MKMKKVEIDAQGFNNMIRELKSHTKEQTREIVRSVTNEILLNTARRTKVAKTKDIKSSVLKGLRQPFQRNGDGAYHLTKKGKLWVSPTDERHSYDWALIKENVKTPPKTMGAKIPYGPKTKSKRGGRKLKGVNLANAKAALREARKYYDRELEYRKSIRGLGQASWLRMISLLKLKIKTAPGISKVASAVKMSPKARLAVRAFKQVGSRDNYAIIIRSFLQAALNNDSNGINAFSLAMNGKTKEFKTAYKKGADKYMSRFASKHGFTIQ